MSKNEEKSYEQRSAEALESIKSALIIIIIVLSFVGLSIVTKLWSS
jgi:hypothetical protein